VLPEPILDVGLARVRLAKVGAQSADDERGHNNSFWRLTMLQDFKNFALKGNVVDLAVAVIIGAAFGKIVGSLVDDIIMPVIGALTGGLDFSNYYKSFSAAVHSDMTYEEAKKLGAAIGYGQFLTVVVNFLIIAFVLFIVIRQIEKLKKPSAAAPTPPKSEILLEEIRDLLKGK
jgi:large conductance mechanosensitive channel